VALINSGARSFNPGSRYFFGESSSGSASPTVGWTRKAQRRASDSIVVLRAFASLGILRCNFQRWHPAWGRGRSRNWWRRRAALAAPGGVITVPCRLRVSANLDSWGLGQTPGFLPRSPWFKFSARNGYSAERSPRSTAFYSQGKREGLLPLISLLHAFKDGKLPLLRIEALIPSPFPASPFSTRKSSRSQGHYRGV